GDLEAGGNSDSISGAKTFQDNAGVTYCHDLYMVGNVNYHACDDAMDTVLQDSLIEGNYNIAPGPTSSDGIKFYYLLTGMVARGNVCYFDKAFGCDYRTQDEGTVTFWNNTVVRPWYDGFSSNGVGTHDLRNNLAAWASQNNVGYSGYDFVVPD